MSSVAEPPEENAESLPPASRYRRPRIRQSITYVLMAALVALGIISHYWDRISLWRNHHRVANLLHIYRDAEALELLRQNLLVQPNNAETIIQLARVHRRLGSLQKSLLLTQTAEQLGTNSQRAALERKLVAVQSGQIRDFDKELPQLIVEAGDYGPDIMQSYVLGLFANLRTEEAFSLLEGWESSSPNDALPKFLLAYLWQGINRWPEAAEAYGKGLQLAPHMTPMRIRLAQTLIESGDFRGARSEIEQCLTENPSSSEAVVILAKCYLAENETDSALAKLNPAIEVHPNDLEARRLRGQILLANGDPTRARDDLQFVAEKEPNDAPAHEALGRSLQLAGRADEAKVSFEKASRLTKEQAEIARLIRQVLTEGQNADLRFDIGVRLMQFGSPEDGAKWLRSVFEIQPNHVGAHLALADFWQRRGDFANAEAYRASGEAIRASTRATTTP